MWLASEWVFLIVRCVRVTAAERYKARLAGLTSLSAAFTGITPELDRWKFIDHLTGPGSGGLRVGAGAMLASLPAAQRIGLEANELARARAFPTVSSAHELESASSIA